MIAGLIGILAFRLGDSYMVGSLMSLFCYLSSRVVEKVDLLSKIPCKPPVFKLNHFLYRC
jgi:hypothetical protein